MRITGTRLAKFLKFLSDSHRFFCRESQHYVLGNWSCYIEDRREVRKYRMDFLPAYFRFMRLSIGNYCSH